MTDSPTPPTEADALATVLIHAVRSAGLRPGKIGSAVQFTKIGRELLASGAVTVDVHAALAWHSLMIESRRGRD